MGALQSPEICTPGGQRFQRVSLCFVCMLSRFCHIQVSETLWTVAYYSKGFPRQEYWSGLPFLSSGDLPDPRIESPSLSCIAGEFFTAEPPPTF